MHACNCSRQWSEHYELCVCAHIAVRVCTYIIACMQQYHSENKFINTINVTDVEGVGNVDRELGVTC